MFNRTLLAALGLFVTLGVASPTKIDALAPRDCTPTPTAIASPSCAPWVIGQKDQGGSGVCASLSPDKKSLIVEYPQVGDFTYDVVHVWIGTTQPTGDNPGTNFGSYPWSSDKTPTVCKVNGGTATCTIPLDDPSFPKADLCNTKFYIITHASVTSQSTGKQETGTAGTSCIHSDCKPWFKYWSFSIACGCTETPPPPPETKWCPIGTAFGYSVSPQSLALNSLNPKPKTCNRWGWYTPVTATGASGKLYVGAGGNDISKATEVGTWTAIVTGLTVTVNYDLTPVLDGKVYSITEAHVYASCDLPTTCAPGQYTWSWTGDNTQILSTGTINTGCMYGIRYIIVHAAVSQQFPVEDSCPAPVV